MLKTQHAEALQSLFNFRQPISQSHVVYIIFQLHTYWLSKFHEHSCALVPSTGPTLAAIAHSPLGQTPLALALALQPSFSSTKFKDIIQYTSWVCGTMLHYSNIHIREFGILIIQHTFFLLPTWPNSHFIIPVDIAATQLKVHGHGIVVHSPGDLQPVVTQEGTVLKSLICHNRCTTTKACL